MFTSMINLSNWLVTTFETASMSNRIISVKLQPDNCRDDSSRPQSAEPTIALWTSPSLKAVYALPLALQLLRGFGRDARIINFRYNSTLNEAGKCKFCTTGMGAVECDELMWEWNRHVDPTCRCTYFVQWWRWNALPEHRWPIITVWGPTNECRTWERVHLTNYCATFIGLIIHNSRN